MRSEPTRYRRYVDATHQSLSTHFDRTVWTFYWALADGSPSRNRQMLLEKDWSFCKEAILRDLERVHKDIRQCVSRIRHHANGSRDRSPHRWRGNLWGASKIEAAEWPNVVRQFRSMWHFHFRGSPIPRSRSSSNRVTSSRRPQIALNIDSKCRTKETGRHCY